MKIWPINLWLFGMVVGLNTAFAIASKLDGRSWKLHGFIALGFLALSVFVLWIIA